MPGVSVCAIEHQFEVISLIAQVHRRAAMRRVMLVLGRFTFSDDGSDGLPATTDRQQAGQDQTGRAKTREERFHDDKRDVSETYFLAPRNFSPSITYNETT